MLVTLSEAARKTGAPSQPALHRMTKNKLLPSFLVQTENGWRVETDDPAWTRYLNRVFNRVEPQKQAGNRVKQLKKRTKRSDPSDGETKAVQENTNVQKAIEAKIIYNSRREKLKMEQDEVKTNVIKEVFVDKGEAEYWLSFVQREIFDSFSVVKHCMGEVKRCIMAGEDGQAERALTNALAAAFKRNMETLSGALSGEIEDD
ncbi:MAG: hypothetical protein LBH85_03290 [Treponema sp.]|jgi:hypothetical protein|nr:hypothetical protein [Treponema sp.]